MVGWRPCFDEALQFGEFAVALGGHGLRFSRQELKLRAVVPDRLEPFRQLEVTEMDAAATADREVFLVEVGVLELVGRQRVVVDVGVLIEVLLESVDAFLQLSILSMVRSSVRRNESTELSSRLRKLTFIMAMRISRGLPA